MNKEVTVKFYRNSSKRRYKINPLLKREIQKRGFTQSGLAKRIGLSQSYMTDLLAGNRRTADKVIVINQILDMDIRQYWNTPNV